ncbi:cytochrome P450 [Irpex lacteus]|nr:cytochrome P450 [Irpex lacteus]
MSQVTFLLLPVLVAAAYSLIFPRKRSNHGPLPAFILGNALQIPKQKPWLQFTEWGRTYGNVVVLWIFREQMVVINSYAVASSLLEGPRSVQYADKPRVRMAEMGGYGSASLVQSYTKPLRHSRKLMQAELSSRSIKSYQSLQEQETRRFIKRLLQDSQSFLDHVRLSVSANLLMITYGYQVQGPDDTVMCLAESVMKDLSDVVTPFAWLIDCIPALNMIPPWLTGLQSTAEKYRAKLNKFANMPYDRVVGQVLNGTALPSILSNQLDGQLDTISAEDTENLKYTVAALYAAGTDTTISFLSTFFLAMALHPKFQKKAQEEIERELGKKALPTFADRQRLPYIDCIIKELLRWRPPVPCMVRATLTDDIIDGVHVSAGATIGINTWAFTRDPDLYKRPEEFDPDRFECEEDQAPLDPRRYAFGYNRRICPGMDYVNAAGYIMIATVLACFKILPETDDVNKHFHLANEYTSGIVRALNSTSVATLNLFIVASSLVQRR